jgi:hypothetical protein
MNVVEKAADSKECARASRDSSGPSIQTVSITTLGACVDASNLRTIIFKKGIALKRDQQGKARPPNVGRGRNDAREFAPEDRARIWSWRLLCSGFANHPEDWGLTGS